MSHWHVFLGGHVIQRIKYYIFECTSYSLYCKSCILLRTCSSILINNFYVFPFSYVLGTASNCWLTRMDRLLTPGVSKSEKDTLKSHMLELVDIYYWALDAPKNGTKVISNHGLRSMFYRSTILLCKFPHATTTSNWYVINHPKR